MVEKVGQANFSTIFVMYKASSEIRGAVELQAIVPEIMESMKTTRFTTSFHAFLLPISWKHFGKGALQKLLFSSVFEAHASKTCEPPIETMISMHVGRGLVSS